MTIARMLAFSIGLAVVGCGNVAVDKGDAPGPVTFKGDGADTQGATVFLRQHDMLGNGGVAFEVVARGVPDLHGIAFRLTYDPEALTFGSADVGPKWSKNALALASEGAPGEALVTWTERGETGFDATKEVVLGNVVFSLASRKGATVSFKVERSLLVDRKGVKVGATFRGGTLAAR